MYLDADGSLGLGLLRSWPTGVSITAASSPCGCAVSGSGTTNLIWAAMCCWVFAMMLSSISRLGPSCTTLPLAILGCVLSFAAGRWKTLSSSTQLAAEARMASQSPYWVSAGPFSKARFASISSRYSTKHGVCNVSAVVLLDLIASLIGPS